MDPTKLLVVFSQKMQKLDIVHVWFKVLTYHLRSDFLHMHKKKLFYPYSSLFMKGFCFAVTLYNRMR